MRASFPVNVTPLQILHSVPAAQVRLLPGGRRAGVVLFDTAISRMSPPFPECE